MPFHARAAIDLTTAIGPVHDHLFATNLEHIAQSVYNGPWAEMLKARKFAGHDQMYIGPSEGLSHQHSSFGVIVPWEAVNPDFHGVLFVHDNTTFYTGVQSQRITIRRDDGRPHGIRQRGLALHAGRAYALRLVLKGEGQPVTVHLGDQTWTIPAAGETWTTYTATLTPGVTGPDGVLAITFQGKRSLWVDCASLTPADHVGGFRPDVIAALREHWIPTLIRWPGGNFASAYHWQNGIGDRDRRTSHFDPAWNAWDTNDVGTDDFIALCRVVGSEPGITINMGNGTVEEAAAWVEYCNGAASTPYGAQRAANGHPEPYGVKTWFVGNEQFGNWQVGHCDAETYARRYREFAAAMRAVDPGLTLIAVGVPTDLYGHWNELVLRDAGPHMDALSVHYYSIRTENWQVVPPLSEQYWPRVASAHEVEQMLDRTLAIVAAHSDPPVPVALDEWNTFAIGNPPDFFESYSVADALYAGALTHACLRRCDRITLSAIFNLINVMGNFRVTPDVIWPTPTTLVLALLTRHHGPLAVRCTVESPTIATPGLGNLPAFDAVPLIDAAATTEPVAHRVYLSLVNRDPERSAAVTLSGIARAGAASVYTVAGDGPLAQNTAEDPAAVQIETGVWPDGTDVLDLPPHSFTLVTITLASE